MSGRDGGGLEVGERGAERVARVYGTLSAAYEAIVRIRQRLPLFEQVCRVLVEQGQLRMAWVGEVDARGRIVPVAHAGVTDGYLDDLRISVRDVAEGRGPTGTAAREQRHMFVTDIATDERMGPWREAALARGYRSSAAFPLTVDDRCVAVLTAYASEPGFFDEQQVELFHRMAADLSFALEAMERDERRRALEAELRSSEEQFRAAAESMLDGFGIISPVRDDAGKVIDFRYEYVNDVYCALVGFDREQLVGRRLGELSPSFPGGERFAAYRRVAATGEPYRAEDTLDYDRSAGTTLAHRVVDIAIASMGEGLVLWARDITERNRAEAELARVQSLLERTQQISKTGGWEYDIATGKLTWTDEVYRIYGIERTSDPTELAPAIAAYDQKSAPVSREAFERLIAEGEPYDLELCLIRGDGQRIWVRVIGRPVVEDGRVVRVNGAIADITERKRSEQELQLRAELLDLAHDAVIVREPAESRVTFWNREAEAIYGYSRAEAVGRVTHDLLATVSPESPEVIEEVLAREGRWDGELRHTRKDGKVITVSSRQALARDEDGRPLAIIELNSDITERKRDEEELAEITGLLERTQQISKTGGWEYDLATGKLTLTDEVYRISGGRDRGDGPVEPERAISAFDAESAPVIGAALERLVADGQPCDLEVGLIRADGQRIWVRVVGEAVIEGGRVVRVRGIITDVNDRRMAEEEIRALNAELEQRVAARTTELERVNHELETFAYSVSHDLRGPLRAVDGFSKVLLDDYAQKLGGDARHYLERVRAGAVRMGMLIDEILKLSRLSRQRFEREPIDISALARETVAELRSVEPDRKVEVEIEDGLVAEADRGLVESVLQNLFGNAFKFTANTDRARVRFGAVEQDGVPVYFVADNGAGFAMAHAKGLFRPFQRLHRQSEFPGTGIGLATVVRAVHRHGGAVWAHGALNEGATFYFTLTPGAHPPANAATGEDVAPSWQPPEQEGSR